MTRISEDYLARISDALVSEIKAEMGRQGISSSRELGRLIGESSQFVSSRLDGGNPRTGIRVPLNIKDIAAIANVLRLEPADLVARAKQAVDRDARMDIAWPDDKDVIVRMRPGYPAEALDEAAREGLEH